MFQVAAIWLSVLALCSPSDSSAKEMNSMCVDPKTITNEILRNCTRFGKFENGVSYKDYRILGFELRNSEKEVLQLLKQSASEINKMGASCLFLVNRRRSNSLNGFDLRNATQYQQCIRLDGFQINLANELAHKKKLILNKCSLNELSLVDSDLNTLIINSCSFDHSGTLNLSETKLKTLHVSGSSDSENVQLYGIDNNLQLESVRISNAIIMIKKSLRFDKMKEFFFDECGLNSRYFKERSYSEMTSWRHRESRYYEDSIRLRRDAYGIFHECSFGTNMNLDMKDSPVSALVIWKCNMGGVVTVDVSNSTLDRLAIPNPVYLDRRGNVVLKGLDKDTRLTIMRLMAVQINGDLNLKQMKGFLLQQCQFNTRLLSTPDIAERNFHATPDRVYGNFDITLQHGVFQGCNFKEETKLDISNSRLTHLSLESCGFSGKLSLDVSKSSIRDITIQDSSFGPNSPIILNGIHTLKDLQSIWLEGVQFQDISNDRLVDGIHINGGLKSTALEKVYLRHTRFNRLGQAASMYSEQEPIRYCESQSGPFENIDSRTKYGFFEKCYFDDRIILDLTNTSMTHLLFDACRLGDGPHLITRNSAIAYLKLSSCTFVGDVSLDVSDMNLSYMAIHQPTFGDNTSVSVRGIHTLQNLQHLWLEGAQFQNDLSFKSMTGFILRYCRITSPGNDLTPEKHPDLWSNQLLIFDDLSPFVDCEITSNEGRIEGCHFDGITKLDLTNLSMTHLKIKSCTFFGDLVVNVSQSNFSHISIERSTLKHHTHIVLEGLHTLRNLKYLRLEFGTLVDLPSFSNLHTFQCVDCIFNVPSTYYKLASSGASSTNRLNVLDIAGSPIKLLNIVRPTWSTDHPVTIIGVSEATQLEKVELHDLTIANISTFASIREFSCDQCTFDSNMLMTFENSKMEKILITNPRLRNKIMTLSGIHQCPLKSLNVAGNITIHEFQSGRNDVEIPTLEYVKIHETLMKEIQIPSNGNYTLNIIGSNMKTVNLHSNNNTTQIKILAEVDQCFEVKYNGPILNLKVMFDDTNISRTYSESGELSGPLSTTTILICGPGSRTEHGDEIEKSPQYVKEKIPEDTLMVEKPTYDNSEEHILHDESTDRFKMSDVMKVETFNTIPSERDDISIQTGKEHSINVSYESINASEYMEEPSFRGRPFIYGDLVTDYLNGHKMTNGSEGMDARVSPIKDGINTGLLSNDIVLTDKTSNIDESVSTQSLPNGKALENLFAHSRTIRNVTGQELHTPLPRQITKSKFLLVFLCVLFILLFMWAACCGACMMHQLHIVFLPQHKFENEGILTEVPMLNRIYSLVKSKMIRRIRTEHTFT